MSDPTAPEPTMEEILASIRRIISEDDAPAAEPAPPAPEPEPEPEPAPAPVAVAPPPPEEEEDVLELTEPAPEPAETHGDIDVFAPEPEPEPLPLAPEPVAAPPPPVHVPSFAPEADEEGLVSGGIQDRAAQHFGKLAQSIAMPDLGRTLEDVVRELLRPLLKEWLDENLPAIVEEKVQAEVERISRRRV